MSSPRTDSVWVESKTEINPCFFDTVQIQNAEITATRRRAKPNVAYPAHLTLRNLTKCLLVFCPQLARNCKFTTRFCSSTSRWCGRKQLWGERSWWWANTFVGLSLRLQSEGWERLEVPCYPWDDGDDTLITQDHKNIWVWFHCEE